MVDTYVSGPFSQRHEPDEFRRRLLDVARWADASDFRGLLLYTDNTVLDPWTLAQLVIERTGKLVPVVGTQPMYMHPYAAARMVSTTAFLYGRRVDINLVTGGNPADSTAIGCRLEHHERYRRLVEYGQVMLGLLGRPEALNFHGDHYTMTGAVLRPGMVPELAPTVFVAGSSPAAAAAAQALDAPRLVQPRPVHEYEGQPSPLAGTGVRIGIIARDTDEAAWRQARRRFTLPADAPRSTRDPHWLRPPPAFQEFCPYLVGSHASVAGLLRRYLELGLEALIVSTPSDEDDLHHTRQAIRQATPLTATDRGGVSAPRPGR